MEPSARVFACDEEEPRSRAKARSIDVTPDIARLDCAD